MCVCLCCCVCACVCFARTKIKWPGRCHCSPPSVSLITSDKPSSLTDHRVLFIQSPPVNTDGAQPRQWMTRWLRFENAVGGESLGKAGERIIHLDSNNNNLLPCCRFFFIVIISDARKTRNRLPGGVTLWEKLDQTQKWNLTLILSTGERNGRISILIAPLSVRPRACACPRQSNEHEVLLCCLGVIVLDTQRPTLQVLQI